jgi:hypothetical protein
MAVVSTPRQEGRVVASAGPTLLPIRACILPYPETKSADGRQLPASPLRSRVSPAAPGFRPPACLLVKLASRYAGMPCWPLSRALGRKNGRKSAGRGTAKICPPPPGAAPGGEIRQFAFCEREQVGPFRRWGTIWARSLALSIYGILQRMENSTLCVSAAEGVCRRSRRRRRLRSLAEALSLLRSLSPGSSPSCPRPSLDLNSQTAI